MQMNSVYSESNILNGNQTHSLTSLLMTVLSQLPKKKKHFTVPAFFCLFSKIHSQGERASELAFNESSNMPHTALGTFTYAILFNPTNTLSNKFCQPHFFFFLTLRNQIREKHEGDTEHLIMYQIPKMFTIFNILDIEILLS